MALKKALGSDYGNLKQYAVKAAMGSGNRTLTNPALES